jgi:hypothetical protein
MAELDALLAEIERQIDAVKVAAAQDQMTHLLRTIGDQELTIWEIDLRRTINHFLPKRRKALMALLEQRLHGSPAFESAHEAVGSHAELDELIAALQSELANLSSLHIFQWSTFYRDSLGTLFDQFFDACRVDDRPVDDALVPVTSALRTHSTDIFQKGYNYFTRTTGTILDLAVAKGLAGLQRFLDLPIEFYSLRVNAPRTGRDTVALRSLVSAMLSGIAEGFAEVAFDRGRGREVLNASPGQWAYILPFLSSSHLGSLVNVLGTEPFVPHLESALHPLASALDNILTDTTETIALPALSFYNASQLRFDVSLSAPVPGAVARNLDVQIHLDPGSVSRPALQESSRRGTAMILAPLSSELYSVVQGDERLSQILVDWFDSATATKKCRGVLEYALYKHASARLASQPLQYNFAQDFPLHNPFMTRYVHVHRSSVRELARTFERRNGVRLWCSVRRSGKTTSCIDLGSSDNDSTFVIQTCAGTNQIAGGTRFYETLLSTIEGGGQLPVDFFAKAVEDCAQEGTETTRFVFVLDEYETLFGRLRACVRADDTTRYTILQPLLDQMVAFTRENLLVFLGQQPTAHYVFMEQNQLSAYVEQDSFPLFRRSVGQATDDEFSELISRVFAQRAGYDAAFADELFSETAGHPYLTVKLLTAFVDFLIERDTPAGSLFLVGADFHEFKGARLNRRHLLQEKAYSFFREAVAEATSRDCKAYSPWLFSVYSLLRALGRASPESLSISVDDFAGLFDRLKLPSLGFSAEELLGSASQANFFDEEGGVVRARIPLLARIAAVSTPRVAG